MIVCRTCGGHNADTDTFCGSCGDFLEWTGEKVQPPSVTPQQRAVTPVPPAPVGPPPMGPAPAVDQKATAGPAQAPGPAQAAGPAQVAGPVQAASPAQAAGPAQAGKPAPGVAPKPVAREWKPAIGGSGPSKPAVGDSGPRTPAALVTPVPKPLPAPPPLPKPPPVPEQTPAPRKPQPAQVRPQPPVRRRPAVPPAPSPPTRPLQPDDLICGACGEGNPSERRFCSRCGESLQTATVTVVPTPWWQQILKLFDRKVHPAGARPKRRARLLTMRGWSAMLRRVLVVALLLLGLLYAVFPGMRSLVNGQVRALKNGVASAITQKPAQIRAISTTADAQLPDHPGSMATDGFFNRFWEAPDAAAKPTLMLEFDHPTQLVDAIVHNGGSDDFQALARPKQLHFVYFDGGTVVGASDVTLEDGPDSQTVSIGADHKANRVAIQVMSFYPSTEGNPALALSEIEFFERR